MRILYLARGLLDYRIPVLSEIDKILNNEFYVVFSGEYIPERVAKKIKTIMGNRAIGVIGERGLGLQQYSGYANKKIQLSYHPDIYKTIYSVQPNIIITNGFGQWTFFALIYKILHRTKIVICYERTFHTERNAQWFRLIFRKFIARYIDAFSCNGRLSKNYTLSLGVSDKKITIGHMAADNEGLAKIASAMSSFEIKKIRDKWGNPELVFLAAGNLNERKGIRELINGWRRLEQEVHGEWRLVLIGDGSMEKVLKNQVKTLNLRNVIFVGPIDYDIIAKYYAATDCFVMPTLEDNWSLVVPEAMACGLPILCSCYNGCYPELIEPEGNGWVFDPLNETDTFNALHRCVINRGRLAKMGERSKEIVAKYTPENAAKAILDACCLALEKK
jgi:glycosyltransferase involved in cell wall biosynthesis